MQKSDFPIEIVIGDDCSNDKTRDILLEYQQKNPQLIRLLLREKNIGVVPNFADTISTCKGKYIALCEGDDYWTDPLKLQKQVDFLESHKECTSCFHDVLYQYDDGELKPSPYNHTSIKETYTIDDLLVKNVWTKTCSSVFHNGIVNQELDSFSHLKIGDWPLFVLLASKGNIGYVHEVMGVYRVHANSTFSTIGQVEQLKAQIESRHEVNKFLKFRYSDLLRPEIFKYSYALANCYLSQGEKQQARKLLMKCITNLKYHKKISRLEVIEKFIKSLSL